MTRAAELVRNAARDSKSSRKRERKEEQRGIASFSPPQSRSEEKRCGRDKSGREAVHPDSTWAQKSHSSRIGVHEEWTSRSNGLERQSPSPLASPGTETGTGHSGGTFCTGRSGLSSLKVRDGSAVVISDGGLTNILEILPAHPNSPRRAKPSARQPIPPSKRSIVWGGSVATSDEDLDEDCRQCKQDCSSKVKDNM